MTSDAESTVSDVQLRIASAPIESQYPVTIWVAGRVLAPGLVDTVSTNIKIMLNALGVPVVAVLYYRMRCTSIPGDTSHLFIAVDERQRVVRVPSARLSLITATIDANKLKEYTASITADPLGALLLKVGGGTGERINRFPTIFGYRAPRGEAHVYDRTGELQALRRDGYFALTFLPVPGVDHRVQLTTEIASLWGYSVAGYDKRWPDLLVLRNDAPGRDDLGGVPDETWLLHALSRVLEDHLPLVEIDGLWMGSLPRKSKQHLLESRSKVFYAILDWVRMRRLPYITARTFHCYVRRDLSAVVALGSLRDRMEIVEWLQAYPYDLLLVSQAKNETDAALAIFGGRMVDPTASRGIALRDSGSNTWLIVTTEPPPPSDQETLDKSLREYYGSKEACNAPGSPITSTDISRMSLTDLLKIVRITECEAAASGVCLSTAVPLPDLWTTSHRAYRAAVRSQVLRTHDTLGVYRMGPYASPFFAFEVHQFVPMPSESRYNAVISEVGLAPDIGQSEDALLKALVGTVWLLTIQEAATATTQASEIDVMQVASDREPEQVRRTLFDAWKSGYLIGIWCRVMLTHREALSISVAGGTVDPLVAHSGDSVVDGNRWLDATQRALKDCA